MTSTRTWFGIVAALGLVPALVLCLVYGFVPKWDDLKDPLGRPSSLSTELIHSADQIDQLTAEMAPKHRTLSSTIQRLQPLSESLTALTEKAGQLPGSARTVNNATTGVANIARPLPSLIREVIGDAETSQVAVGSLVGSVDGVANQLQRLDSNLTAVQSTLKGLGSKADRIAATLKTIQEEAARVAIFGPLLATLGPAVNGPQRPAPPIPQGAN
ncbi:hypothetical protein HWD35_24500 [Tsukamurella tyrosinosolvens]|uniref:hypothetical protein n=1 Tax=Tsukamurella tyrosinosolvens TaxID=57704 RepID=UPI001CE1E65E|nr:hypothetical protein [Tsukamurella tyrosinosolvens]MCA4997883.1 hypothetical protein [Tsukamurella tyrosinosolvens]